SATRKTVSVARYAGFENLSVRFPSAEALGYFQASAARTMLRNAFSFPNITIQPLRSPIDRAGADPHGRRLRGVGDGSHPAVQAQQMDCVLLTRRYRAGVRVTRRAVCEHGWHVPL